MGNTNGDLTPETKKNANISASYKVNTQDHVRPASGLKLKFIGQTCAKCLDPLKWKFI